MSKLSHKKGGKGRRGTTSCFSLCGIKEKIGAERDLISLFKISLNYYIFLHILNPFFSEKASFINTSTLSPYLEFESNSKLKSLNRIQTLNQRG